jgi:putative phosphoesterase
VEQHATVPSADGADPVRIGVLSDTHGRVDPAVLSAFAGVTHIIHAGDVGKRSVLRRLEAVAPVTAVAGNADSGRLAKELPAQAMGEAGGVRFLVAHKPKQLKKLLRRGVPEGVDLIVTGHLHEPSAAWEDGALHLNPGTASAPEEGDPAPTIAVVSRFGDSLSVTFIPVLPGREDGGAQPAGSAAEDARRDEKGTHPESVADVQGDDVVPADGETAVTLPAATGPAAAASAAAGSVT